MQGEGHSFIPQLFIESPLWPGVSPENTIGSKVNGHRAS